MNFNKCHLHIYEDFYDDFDVKILERQLRKSGVKEGMFIFFKLLIKAGNDNALAKDEDLCLIHLHSKIDFIEELALCIDEEPEAVRTVVDVLLELGFLEKENEDKYMFYLPGGIEVRMHNIRI